MRSTTVSAPDETDRPMVLPSLFQAADPAHMTSVRGLFGQTQAHLLCVARVFFHSGLVHLFERFPELDALVLPKGNWSGFRPDSFKDFVEDVVLRADVPQDDVVRRKVDKALADLRVGLPKDNDGISAVMAVPRRADRIHRITRENAADYLRQVEPEGAWMAARHEARQLDGALAAAPAAPAARMRL